MLAHPYLSPKSAKDQRTTADTGHACSSSSCDDLVQYRSQRLSTALSFVAAQNTLAYLRRNIPVSYRNLYALFMQRERTQHAVSSSFSGQPYNTSVPAQASPRGPIGWSFSSTIRMPLYHDSHPASPFFGYLRERRSNSNLIQLASARSFTAVTRSRKATSSLGTDTIRALHTQGARCISPRRYRTKSQRPPSLPLGCQT